MKKYIIILLVINLFATNGYAEKEVRLDRKFPMKKLNLLQTVTKDTLIFARTDTVYETKFEWGFWHPLRYVAPCAQEMYFKVAVTSNLIKVEWDLKKGKTYNSGEYTPAPLQFKWLYMTAFCYLYLMLGVLLVFILRKIHSDKRYVKKRRQMLERILVAILCAMIGIAIGYLVQTYFFIYVSGIYLIFMFLPARTWYSRLMRMETSDY